MNPRYFVTIKHWDGDSIQNNTVPLGRFSDHESAQLSATVRFHSAKGVEVIGVRPETRLEAITHSTLRFAIRTLRVSAGVAISLFAYGWASSGPEIGNIPFSALNFDMLGSSIGRGVVFVGALYASWHIAFGEGPESEAT